MLNALGRIILLLAILAPAAARPAAAAESWPPGTELVPFDNTNGLILVHSTLHSPTGLATSGVLVFDTGAPDLTVTRSVWTSLHLDTLDQRSGLSYLRRPLDALDLSRTRLPKVSITGVIPDGVLDDEVVGLFGPNLLGERAILIDYDARQLAIVNRSLTLMHYDSTQSRSEPERVHRSRARFGAILTRDAVAVPFRLFRGGRMLIDVRVEDPDHGWRSSPLTLLLDTGASACALFDDAVAERASRITTWPRESGHMIRTVLGESPSDFVTLPRLRLTGAIGDVAPVDVWAGVNARAALPDIQGELPEAVHGLLGATFLRRYRVVIDYADQTLWLLPRGQAKRAATVRAGNGARAGAAGATGRFDAGIALERVGDDWLLASWREGSAAASSGLELGDRVVSIDGRRIGGMETGADALLMGAPGSTVMVVVSRGGMDRVFRLRRGGTAAPARGNAAPARRGDAPPAGGQGASPRH